MVLFPWPFNGILIANNPLAINNLLRRWAVFPNPWKRKFWTTVSIDIRQADLKRDKAALIDTLFKYLTPDSDEKRFNWLYEDSPEGPARAWLATDTDTQTVIGVSGAFARRITVNGGEKTGWVLGDFCIAEQFRSLGPALRLQKATLEQITDAEGSAFCYDFPSQGLMAIYRRLGMKARGQMLRLAKPLLLNRKLAQLGGPKLLARGGAWLGNLMLLASDMTFTRKGSWDFRIHEGECGDEFAALHAAHSAPNTIAIARSAEFYNWRYVRHPLVQYSILTARQNNVLKGFVIFSCTEEDAYIAEWCVSSDRALFSALMNDLAERLRSKGIMTLSAFLMTTDPCISQFTSIGFRSREARDVVVFCQGAPELSTQPWLLMHGDRDI